MSTREESDRPVTGDSRGPAQQTRVRWWAVALPVTAFVVLLSLVASPAAQAGERGGHASSSVLEQVMDVLPKLLLGLFG